MVPVGALCAGVGGGGVGVLTGAKASAFAPPRSGVRLAGLSVAIGRSRLEDFLRGDSITGTRVPPEGLRGNELSGSPDSAPMARNRIDEDLRAPESADICVGVVGGIPRAAALLAKGNLDITRKIQFRQLDSAAVTIEDLHSVPRFRQAQYAQCATDTTARPDLGTTYCVRPDRPETPANAQCYHATCIITR